MKLVFDVTTSSNWQGVPSGIPRVECKIIDFFKKKSNITLVKGDTESGFDSNSEKTQCDWVISVGATWNYQSWLDFVKRIKNSCNCQYAHFIHDLIPIKFPYLYEERFDLNFTHWLKNTIDLADLLICPSESTVRDLSAFIEENSLRKPRIEKVRLGDIDFLQNDPVIAPYFKDLGKYFLMVGTLEQRKNHQVIFDAIRLLDRKKLAQGFKLVVVGRSGWLPNNLISQMEEDPVLKRYVIYFDNLSDEKLLSLIKNAFFSVYPSLYEGWGLPVAESLSQNIPVIISNRSSLLEIAPGLLDSADPYDAFEWANIIEKYLIDSNLVLNKKNEILNSFTPTNWDKTASDIFSLLKDRNND